MLIDEIKAAKVQAMKDHNEDAKTALSMLVSSYLLLNVENRAKGKETSDGEVVTLIQKSINSLKEEQKMYAENGREASVKSIENQIASIQVFLPKMLSEEEIVQIIEKLDDKSIKNVMMTFKRDYLGKVDMSLVSQIAKRYN